MTRMNRQQRLDALAFLNWLEASSETERVENASCFVVCAWDSETNRRSYHGPFADSVEAMRWANDFSVDLNSDLGHDQPYLVTVEIVSKIEAS
jgi:hypothetical protein